ncbi:MAG: hypothetical protein Q4F00_05560 [bacterium]|nr:hypothetical protein [bacterium]
MKNLPIVSQNVLRNCKVFAIAGMLSLCCACGGSEPADNPEGNVSSSPVSGEVDVKGDEVQSASGEATAEENKTEQTSEAVASGNSSESEPAEVADNGSDNQAQAKQNEAKVDNGPTRKNLATTKVRDPFDKYYGAPAIGTSLTGGVKPSSDRGSKGLNSAYQRKIAAKKALETPKPVVKVHKPDVKVTGILRSGSNYQAILQGPEKAIMVSSGETIGGYRVAAVTSQDVTLVYKGKYKFVIPLEKEVFGSMGTPDPAAGNLSSKAAFGPPVIEHINK